MAFFEVVIITNLGTVAPICFALIDNERQEGFNWLVSQLDALRNQSGIPAPEVVITNHESALKNALTETLEARQQLYIFHQNKNAILNIKRKWIGP